MWERVFGTGCRRLIARALCVLVLCAASAQARPDGDGEQLRPWAAGVTESEQALAFEIYRAGNAEFAESHVVEALAKYREAIRHWDHPSIRLNLAACLIQLGQPVEARENLERSFDHGEAALGSDAYRQAETYRKLLDALVVRLTITSSEVGAEITLDGKLLFVGPGSAHTFVAVGEHHVVATKAGRFVMTMRTFTATAGKPVELEIRPQMLVIGGHPSSGYTPAVQTPRKKKAEPQGPYDVAIHLKSSGPRAPPSSASRPSPPPASPSVPPASPSVPSASPSVPSASPSVSPSPTSAPAEQPKSSPQAAQRDPQDDAPPWWLTPHARGLDRPFLRPPTPPPSIVGRGSSSSPPAATRGSSAASAWRAPSVRIPSPRASGKSSTSTRAPSASPSRAPSTYRAPSTTRLPR